MMKSKNAEEIQDQTTFNEDTVEEMNAIGPGEEPVIIENVDKKEE